MEINSKFPIVSKSWIYNSFQNAPLILQCPHLPWKVSHTPESKMSLFRGVTALTKEKSLLVTSWAWEWVSSAASSPGEVHSLCGMAGTTEGGSKAVMSGRISPQQRPFFWGISSTGAGDTSGFDVVKRGNQTQSHLALRAIEPSWYCWVIMCIWKSEKQIPKGFLLMMLQFQAVSLWQNGVLITQEIRQVLLLSAPEEQEPICCIFTKPTQHSYCVCLMIKWNDFLLIRMSAWTA